MHYKQKKIGLTMRQAKKLEKLIKVAYAYIFLLTKKNEKSLEECLKNDKELDKLWSNVMFLVKVGYSSVGKGILPWSTETNEGCVGVKEG